MSFGGNYIQELNKLNELFYNEFGSLSVLEMDYKPDEKSWSINECIDHLILTNKEYFDRFPKLENRSRNTARMIHSLVFPKMFGKIVLKSVSPNQNKKIKTFKAFSPQKSNFGKNIINDLITENSVFIEKIKMYSEEDFENEVVSSPLTTLITYTLEDCICLLIEHEKRHYNQALRIKNSLVSSLSN